MVSRSSLSNSFLNKAKILDADIDNLNVKNLVVENTIETESKHFDVIVVGSGPAAVAATLNLADKLSNTDKKIALFSDAGELSDLDFYKTFVNNPKNLPDGTVGKQELIDNQLARGANGLLGALTGGYSPFNLSTYDIKQDNVYNMKFTDLTGGRDSSVAGPFRGGGLQYVKKIGGLANMNGGVAITNSEYYVVEDGDIDLGVPIDLRPELEYVNSIYPTTGMYPKLKADNSVQQNIDDLNNVTSFSYKLNKSMDDSIFGTTSGITNTNILIEPEYYWSCGRINYQKKLKDAQNANPNLHIFYNSFVDNLEINTVDGEQVCTGIYTNSKLFTADNVILSAGHPGSIALLQSVNNTIERPLSNIGVNWNETQAVIFPCQIANFDPNLATTSNSNYGSSVIYGNITNGNPFQGTAEVYSGSIFNFDYDPHLIKYATAVSGNAITSYNELIKGTNVLPLLLTQAIAFLQGQSLIYDPDWPALADNVALEGLTIGIPYPTPSNPNGTFWDIISANFKSGTQNRPTGFLNFTVFIIYTGTKYNNWLDSSNNVIKYHPGGTINKCDHKSKYINNISSTGGADKNLVTYNSVKHTLKFDITTKYFEFKPETPQTVKDNMIGDLRSLLDKMFYAPNNLRQNLFANLSLGKWDPAAGTLYNLRGWTDQDFAYNPPTFDNYAPYYTKASGMMSDEQFLAQCRANTNPTWHWTQGTSDYIDVNTFEFNDIKGLYSGDQLAFPNPYATSTTLLTSSCAVRASNSVVSKLV